MIMLTKKIRTAEEAVLRIRERQQKGKRNRKQGQLN